MSDVRPVIRDICVPDLEPPELLEPIGGAVCFLVQIAVGPDNGPGEELFDLEVCTPAWLEAQLQSRVAIVGRHLLVVARFDFPAIVAFLESEIGMIRGESWVEVAEKVGRIGRWEFEDYG